MKRSSTQFRGQMAIVGVLTLVLLWSSAAYELHRSQAAYVREAEVRSAVQAQVFAEYSRSSLKRLNEFVLDMRRHWVGDWKRFSKEVVQAQENIDDLTFQVAVIDKEGILAYSNLAKPTDRTDLSEREHFRVHHEAAEADRLFISKPVKGKVSGKWSIQITRPIRDQGRFNGVLVVSVSPDQFAGFAKKLRIGGDSVLTVVRDTGEVMARYPAIDSSLGLVLKDPPYLRPDAPVSGNFRLVSAIEGKERIYGYYKLPEYGLTFLLGAAVNEVLAPYYSHRRMILAAALAVSVLIVIILLLQFRSFTVLEDTRQQLAAIFALSPDGFVSFDAKRRVKYVSPAFTRMTGLEDEDVAGLDEEAFSRHLLGLCAEHARFPGVAAMRAEQQLLTGAGASGGGRRQLIELASAGKRVLEFGIRMSEAKTVSQILYFRDVTHETEVEHLKSEFLSTAAHELRTPMASIFGYSELMLSEDFTSEERSEFVGIIYRQSQLMIAIINELLDLVRIEERRGKDFDVTRVELGELLREVINNFKAPQGRAAPVVPSRETPHHVLADRNKLIQMVSNVLSNAYKYSPAGGAVDVALVEPEGGAQAGQIGIRISDHGIGLTPGQLARVSERFYRADTSGKIPGTGLGMSIVKEIVELHGGSLSMTSNFGSGTAVTLWLPGA